MVVNKCNGTGLSWNYGEMGKIKYFFDTCPSATLCTTNPTQTGLGFNFCLCSERLGMNCPSHHIA